MKSTQQKIRGQTIDKTIAKPVGVIKNHEKSMICNKAMNAYSESFAILNALIITGKKITRGNWKELIDSYWLLLSSRKTCQILQARDCDTFTTLFLVFPLN